MTNVFRETPDLFGTRLFRRQRIAFSVGEIGHFQSLDLYQEAMDNSNFISFSMEHQTLKKSYLSIGFSMRGPEKCSRPTQAPSLPASAEFAKFCCCQNWKKGQGIFSFPALVES